MGFGHRNCVVIGCPNSGQRLGKWAATTCELHGCNSVVTMAQACATASPPSNYSHSDRKEEPGTLITMGKKYKQEQFEWDSLDA